jgi:hypothetical protein
MNNDRVAGGHYSMREGAKGPKPNYYILFAHFGISWEKWLCELLREVMWCIIACKYINHDFGCWGFLTHSSFVPHSFLFILVLGFWHGNGNVGGRETLLVGCMV